MKQLKGLRAWLVTWEWVGDHAKPPKKIAELLDPRLSPERVREIVEFLYQREDRLSDKVNWRLRKHKQPYPAEFVTIDGVPWQGRIICGHNPHLLARSVDSLIVSTDADGNEVATWTDRFPMPEARAKIRRMRQLGGPLYRVASQ
jgi:hypothetical protein